MSQFFARFVLLGLLATVAVGCGSEPKVMIDKQTAAKLQAERDAEEAAIYAKEMEAMKADPAAMKADPYYNN
jgi:hypothetical protein